MVASEKSSHMVYKMSNEKYLPGFEDISCHMIFKINMDGNVTQKARLVAGIYTTNLLVLIT